MTTEALEQKALACAANNGGLLVRHGDGFWRGKQGDPTVHDAATVYALSKAGKLKYTKAREGSKAAWIEARVV